ncbi:hypothetical protein PORY_002286 [Pneumocystis oryctolagi]|uniref:Uncharacterized protein n=1 Tax=Pneumocystis oryctolagi TaxID=42067 RepID=A0ACB7C9Q8_9ASCO|nr:hypothetical protein PORY_002286 [Pneumocystis oryctolagi]
MWFFFSDRCSKRLSASGPFFLYLSRIRNGRLGILSGRIVRGRLIWSRCFPSRLWVSRLRERWKHTRIEWCSIPLSVGIAYIVLVHCKNIRERSSILGGSVKTVSGSEDEIRVCGPWQVYILKSLPLKAFSRIWGRCSKVILPVWLRVPVYKFYAWIFGCNLYEMAEQDLRKIENFSEFFYRELKPGIRKIDDDALVVSPADGKVLHFGLVEGRRIEQVKGLSYSLDALIGNSSPSSYDEVVFDNNSLRTSEHEENFAKISGITYSCVPSISKDKEDDLSSVNIDVNKIENDTMVNHNVIDKLKKGNRLYFAVIYLAPGDYHRFHSPANWVVEKRRYFSGELFSVSPYFAKRISNLFVLNERVVLLGQYRYGFMSMIPVGATNVGSICIDFDKDFRTNTIKRNNPKGSYTEATYSAFSKFLKGYPLRIGEQMGGFNFGSTIILIFEAPQEFEFLVSQGSRILMGQGLGKINKKAH